MEISTEKKYRYKGVALLGMPGSGKTSVSQCLLRANADLMALEASADLVFPISHVKDAPAHFEQMVSRVVDFHHHSKAGSHRGPRRVSRQWARDIFAKNSRKYGRDWVARLLTTAYPEKAIVISGIRGVENAQKLAEMGYLTVFLKAPSETLIERVAKRDDIRPQIAQKDQEAEETLYRTKEIESFAGLVIDVASASAEQAAALVLDRLLYHECRNCVNSDRNPSIQIDGAGVCSVCRAYRDNLDEGHLLRELDYVKSFVGVKSGKYDAMVGMSGGKDSSAMAFLAKSLGFTPLGFTFDIGYYPDHIFTRASAVARQLGIDHEVLPIKQYISSNSLSSYRLTANLYNKNEDEMDPTEFLELYAEGRRHYSVRDDTAMAYVRTCQLCRKTVIPAYYAEAVKHGVQMVLLGINEWTGLSQDTASRQFRVSGVRKLQPFSDKPPVFVVHLPFLLRLKRRDVENILKNIGWQRPVGEDFVESNSNSCLFARAAERRAYEALGFHPDTTRLSREVTAGFLSKEDAKNALRYLHDYSRSVREVLQDASILDTD